MLLIPLYRSASGGLKRAPVDGDGFEVPKPHEFVRRHPRAVQLAMLVIKAGIKIGAGQLGVAVPAASLEVLSMVTDGLVSDTLQLSIEAMAEEAAAKLGGEESFDDALERHEREQKIEMFLHKEVGAAASTDLLEVLANDAKYKKASCREYAHLRAWLDKLHPSWQAKCGLEPRVCAKTGSVEWLPPTGSAAAKTEFI